MLTVRYELEVVFIFVVLIERVGGVWVWAISARQCNGQKWVLVGRGGVDEGGWGRVWGGVLFRRLSKYR
jgi:hypothetical protein